MKKKEKERSLFKRIVGGVILLLLCMTAGIVPAADKSIEVHAATGSFFDMIFEKGRIFDCDQRFPVTLKNQPFDASVGSGAEIGGRRFSDQDMEDIYFKFQDGSTEDPSVPTALYLN